MYFIVVRLFSVFLWFTVHGSLLGFAFVNSGVRRLPQEGCMEADCSFSVLFVCGSLIKV